MFQIVFVIFAEQQVSYIFLYFARETRPQQAKMESFAHVPVRLTAGFLREDGEESDNQGCGEFTSILLNLSLEIIFLLTELIW